MPVDALELSNQLHGPDPAARLEAAEALARLGDSAQPAAAAAALVRGCGLDDPAICEWCVAALEELGPPPDDQIAELTDLTGHAADDVAYWAITLLGRAGTSAVGSVGALAEAVSSSRATQVRQRAAWALGELGSAAAEARSALQQAATGDDARLARLAAKALEQINS